MGESLESKAGARAGGWECGVQPGLSSSCIGLAVPALPLAGWTVVLVCEVHDLMMLGPSGS